MRLVKYILFFVVALYLGVVLFMPKSQLYYKAEEFLSNKGVVIGNEKIVDTIGSFKLMHPVAYYQGADVARASNIDIKPLLLVNIVNIDNLEFTGVAKKFIKDYVAHLRAKHTIFRPNYVKLDLNGSFGDATGYIDLKKRLVHIDITKPKNIAAIRRFITKGKKGWQYEYKF